ncbi:hypothetical protein SO694_00115086 [Aureococcus anophagefferens]|uniref:Uncharacterized protein n=1 Tax=Aureococcus anophagefferens TaxID=44056 RepID=A0ABR1FWI7_AURAN
MSHPLLPRSDAGDDGAAKKRPSSSVVAVVHRFPLANTSRQSLTEKLNGLDVTAGHRAHAAAHGPAMRRTVARRMLVSDQQLLRDRIRRAADAAAQKRFRRREAQLALQVAAAGSSSGRRDAGRAPLPQALRQGVVGAGARRLDLRGAVGAVAARTGRRRRGRRRRLPGAFVRATGAAVNQHVHYKPRYASLTATELLLFKTEADARRGAPYHAVPLSGGAVRRWPADEVAAVRDDRARSKLGGQSGAPTLVLTSGNSTSKKRRDVLVFASPRPGGDDARDDLEDWLIRARLLARREQQRRAARDHDAAHHDVDAAEEEEAPPRQRSAEDHARRRWTPALDAGASKFASTRV